MSRRGGYTGAGVSSALSGLNSGSTIQAGDIPVGVVDAGGGRYAGLHKSGVKGSELREGEVSGNVAWLPPTTQFSPYDRGYVAEPYPGHLHATTGALVAGKIYLLRCRIAELDAIGSLVTAQSNTPTVLTNSFLGAYQRQAGVLTRLGVTADVSAALMAGAAGNKIEHAISGGSKPVSAGDLYLAFVFGSATVAPSFPRANGTNSANVNGSSLVTTATSTFLISVSTGNTSLPATILDADITTLTQALWFAAMH